MCVTETVSSEGWGCDAVGKVLAQHPGPSLASVPRPYKPDIAAGTAMRVISALGRQEDQTPKVILDDLASFRPAWAIQRCAKIKKKEGRKGQKNPLLWLRVFRKLQARRFTVECNL